MQTVLNIKCAITGLKESHPIAIYNVTYTVYLKRHNCGYNTQAIVLVHT